MKFRIRSHYLEMDEADALMFVGHPIFIGSNGYARVAARRVAEEKYYGEFAASKGVLREKA